jgi:hypothetical protein
MAATSTPAMDTSFAHAVMSTFLSMSALQQSRSLINEPSGEPPVDTSMRDFSSSYTTARQHQPSSERSTFAADIPTLQRVHDIFTLEKAKTFSTRDAWLDQARVTIKDLNLLDNNTISSGPACHMPPEYANINLPWYFSFNTRLAATC